MGGGPSAAAGNVDNVASRDCRAKSEKQKNILEEIVDDKLRLHLFLRFLDESSPSDREVFDCWYGIAKLNKMAMGGPLSQRTASFLEKFGVGGSNTSYSCNISEILHLSDSEKRLLDGNDVVSPTGNRVIRPDLYNWLKNKCYVYLKPIILNKYNSYEVANKYHEVANFAKCLKHTHSDFIYSAILGQGAFGIVLKCKMKKYGERIFAMKVQLKDDMWQLRNGADILIENEIFVRHSDHPYIMDCVCSFNTASLLYLVMPLAHCTLGDLCKNCPDNIMSLPQVQFYAAELVCVLKYLHENSFVYCDLKPSNVMIGMDGHVQLTDFGSTCRVNSYSARCKIVMGTLPYMAPEMILGLSLPSNEWEGYTCAVDWWSLGVLTYGLLVGKTPFDNDLLDPIGDAVNQMPKDVLRKVKAMNRYIVLFKPVDYSMLSESCSVAVRFMMELLEVQENLRFGSNALEKIEDHPFFDDLEWCDIESKTAMPPTVSSEVTEVRGTDEGSLKKKSVRVLDFDVVYSSLETILKRGQGKWAGLSSSCFDNKMHSDIFDDWQYTSPLHSLNSYFECEVASTVTVSAGVTGFTTNTLVSGH